MGTLLFPDGRQLSSSLTAQIAHLVTQTADAYADLRGSTAPLCIKIHLLQILELLYRNHSYIPAAEIPREDARGIYPLKPVFTYIEKHYSEKITLEDLSSSIHMNKNYFCRFFKEKAGKTPFAYLNEYRINQAAGELMKTDLPITEVALNAGFENMSYFIRQFKHYRGCTPSVFRQERH